MFIQHLEDKKPVIDKGVVDLALKSYQAKLANEEVAKAKKKNR